MLAINTAFMTANLALKTADGQVVLKDIESKSKHSESVLKVIDEMCQETGITYLLQNEVLGSGFKSSLPSPHVYRHPRVLLEPSVGSIYNLLGT